ncbi:MAG: phosphatase PAP2 family protein [Acidimicrobiales bacterium]
MAHIEHRVTPENRRSSPTARQARSGLRWYREVAIIGAFYGLYSMSRNLFGSNAVSPNLALDNAERVIRAERLLGSYFEPALQQFFLEWGGGFLRIWNLFYGSLHFVVTAGVFIWLFRRHPDRYPRWRNALGATTGLALVGFSLFPLMPPRLLAAGGPYGGRAAEHAGQFVDTLDRYPALWSFNSDTMQSVSNQYAAMPSLHVGWALWCLCATFPLLRTRWSRGLYLLYVPATVFTIVVTANHYWIDALGGAAVLAVGHTVAGRIEAVKQLRRKSALSAMPATATASAVPDPRRNPDPDPDNDAAALAH